MTSSAVFLTFSTILSLMCAVSADTEHPLDLSDVKKECEEGTNDETIKKACDGTVVPTTELKSTIDTSLQKIGGSTEKKTLNRRTEKSTDKDHIEDIIEVLQSLKTQIKGAYIGVVKETDSLKKKITPEQKDMLEIYLKQLKISHDFTSKKIDECIKKLKEEEKGSGSKWGGKSYSSGGGVSETVTPAIVNFNRQYDDILQYMSEY